MTRRIVAGTTLLVVLTISLIASALSAPPAQQPPLTAFGSGDADLSLWVQDAMDSGFEVHTLVSDPRMVQHVTSEPEEVMLVVPQPQEAPSSDTLDTWRTHLERGGHILVMDGSGASNRFLTEYGVAISGRTIFDPAGGTQNTVPVHAPGTMQPTNAPIMGQSPSAIIVDERSDWAVILQSGEDSFLDIDQNGRIDRTDVPGPHVTAARLTLEAGGQLTVISSTTFFANHYYEDEDAGNQAKLLDLITSDLPQGATILIDESHHGWPFPENQLVGSAQTLHLPTTAVPWMAGSLGVIAVGFLVLALRMSTDNRYRPHELAKTAMEPHLLQTTDGFFTAMATEIISYRSTRTPRTGSSGDGHASSEDWLHQAADGRLRPEDRIRLIQLYESEVNQHA